MPTPGQGTAVDVTPPRLTSWELGLLQKSKRLHPRPRSTHGSCILPPYEPTIPIPISPRGDGMGMGMGMVGRGIYADRYGADERGRPDHESSSSRQGRCHGLTWSTLAGPMTARVTPAASSASWRHRTERRARGAEHTEPWGHMNGRRAESTESIAVCTGKRGEQWCGPWGSGVCTFISARDAALFRHSRHLQVATGNRPDDHMNK